MLGGEIAQRDTYSFVELPGEAVCVFIAFSTGDVRPQKGNAADETAAEH